jgi:uncharacterized protein (TIGR00369 family)
MERLIELYKAHNKFGKANGMHLEINSPGNIRYTMKILPEHLATPIAAHGGIVAAMMDAVLGVTALSLTASQKNVVSTVEFKINYFNPALLDDELEAIGVVENQGKRIIVTSAQIKSLTHNRIVAKGIGTFNAYPAEKAGIII